MLIFIPIINWLIKKRKLLVTSLPVVVCFPEKVLLFSRRIHISMWIGFLNQGRWNFCGSKSWLRLILSQSLGIKSFPLIYPFLHIPPFLFRHNNFLKFLFYPFPPHSIFSSSSNSSFTLLWMWNRNYLTQILHFLIRVCQHT